MCYLLYILIYVFFIYNLHNYFHVLSYCIHVLYLLNKWINLIDFKMSIYNSDDGLPQYIQYGLMKI